jgi:hypothetical protein
MINGQNQDNAEQSNVLSPWEVDLFGAEYQNAIGNAEEIKDNKTVTKVDGGINTAKNVNGDPVVISEGAYGDITKQHTQTVHQYDNSNLNDETTTTKQRNVKPSQALDNSLNSKETPLKLKGKPSIRMMTCMAASVFKSTIKIRSGPLKILTEHPLPKKKEPTQQSMALFVL